VITIYTKNVVHDLTYSKEISKHFIQLHEKANIFVINIYVIYDPKKI